MGFSKEEKAQETEGVDMTEIVAAAAKLHGKKPPSRPVIVPASMFPVSAEIKNIEAAKLAALKEAIGATVRNQDSADEDIYTKIMEEIAREEKIKQDEARQRAKNVKVMEDGTIYLGRFKDSDGKTKDWFAAAEDAKDKKGNKLLLEFDQAVRHAKKSKAHGHKDWIIPPTYMDRDGAPDILNEIFNSRAKVGGLEGDWYWSSSPNFNGDESCAKVQRFNDGHQTFESKWHKLSVRLVRSVAV